MMKTKTNLRTSLITFCQLRIAHCLLPVAICLLLIAYCLLPTVSFAQTANGTGAGNCLSFDGVNDYVSITSLNNMPYTPVTYEAWVKVNALMTGTEFGDFRGIVGRDLSGTTTQGIIVIYGGSDVPGVLNQFVYYTGGALFSSIYVPTIGEWTHIAFVQTGTTATWYINGVVTNTGNFTAIQNANINFNLGSGGNRRTIDGQLDEIRIWNRALTQTEIQQNMCQKLRGNEAGLVSYWRFDEGSGTTAFDASPNGNDGTLQQ